MQNNPRKSEENNFITLLNFIVDPAVIVDEKGHFQIVNNAFEDLTGLSEKELIGTAFLEVSILTAESKAILLENLMKRMQGLSVEPYEITFTDKNGETRCAEVKAKKMDYAGQPADLVLFRDITRRKENARRLKEYSEKMEALVGEKAIEIKESEEKFRNIVENSADVVMLTLPDGIISYMSPSCFSVLGYDPEDLVGKRPAIFHPDDLEKVNKTLSSALNGAKGSDFEYRVITKNGETRWVSHSWSSILENGQVKLIVSVVRGITERKQLEDDLRSSEEKFRAISTSAMDAIILVDDTGKISYWNPAAERIFGYAKEEAVGKDMEKLLMPPQYHGFHSKSAMQSLENVGQTYGRTIEFKALRKDGTPVPIELSVSTFKLKNRRCLLGIIRDVSERKKMEAEIKQERDMLESITQNIGAGLVIISKDYRVLWANNATKRYTGDVDGKLCYTVLHSLDAVCTNCGVKKIFEGEPINAHEYSSTSIDGKPYWVEIIATPIKDKDGNVTAASELAVDITEKKRMQNELAKYSEKLEHLIEERTEQLKQTQAKLVKVQRLATIGELAAMVGHDLRNPLTGIRGATYYLKTKYGVEIDAKGKEMLKTIDECIDHSNKIINDLLEYSREMELDLTETSPKTLLSHSMSMLKIPENIQVIDATEAEPKIMADKAKINRVFVNIIKNAIDAMPNGGTLTVTSKAAEDNLAIAFTDNGIGMSEETLSKLGSPLFTTKSKGMGFGLSICKRIIEAHGGKISVESIIGKGTTVTVTIPINPETVTENEETSVFNEPKVSVLMPQKVETC